MITNIRLEWVPPKRRETAAKKPWSVEWWDDADGTNCIHNHRSFDSKAEAVKLLGAIADTMADG